MNLPHFTLINGLTLNIEATADDVLTRYLRSPNAQVPEMIRQINKAKYYDDVFPVARDLVFLDLGANLGFVSLWASPICQRVVAIEPEPTTFVMLESLMREFAPNVKCDPVALADKTGPIHLSIDRVDYSCHTAVNPKPGNCALKVEGFTLADLIKRHSLEDGIDVCKVDVEGSEMASLTVEALASAPVFTYYIEVHRTPAMPREKSLAVMKARLEKANYRVTNPRPNALIAKRK